MEPNLRFKGREVANQYIHKHFHVDFADCSLGDFVKGNQDKIKIIQDNLGETDYILIDRKMVFYYDYFCSGEIIQSIKDSKRHETVLSISDLNWFFNKLKKRSLENLFCLYP